MGVDPESSCTVAIARLMSDCDAQVFRHAVRSCPRSAKALCFVTASPRCLTKSGVWLKSKLPCPVREQAAMPRYFAQRQQPPAAEEPADVRVLRLCRMLRRRREVEVSKTSWISNLLGERGTSTLKTCGKRTEPGPCFAVATCCPLTMRPPG